MNKINNNKAINNLALSSIKVNIKKYLVLIASVILTTLLFSSLFTVGGSMLKEVQLATMRQVGGSFHSGFKYLCQAEYDQIKDDPKLKDLTYRILVGISDDERLVKTRTEFCYYEAEDAKGSFCYPEAGKMPEAENEIVLSDLTLNALGTPLEVGSHLSIDMQVAGQTRTYDFVLSGYYRGDPISMAQMGLVSKAFQEKYAPTKQIPLPEVENNDYAGWISADFNFSNSLNLEGKTIALIQRCGLRDDMEYGINWAYAGNRIDPSMVVVCSILLLTFFAAGYLIIYNIFYLNIISDMQEYGLLKTIGTTGKQLKKVVLRRASLISAIGIPAGLILGVGVGAVLLPVISNEFSTVSFDKGQLHMNIWIVLGAALFSYITVLFSAGKPCRKAAKVSPIEALKFTEVRGKDGRPKKKMALVVLSLSLSIIVLVGAYAFITGFSMDDYIGDLVIADYSVQDATLDNPGIYDKETQGVNKQFMEEMKNQEGVEEIGNVYISYGSQEFEDETWEKLKENFFSSDLVGKKLESEFGSFEDFNLNDYLKQLDKSKSIGGNTYGMGEFAVKKLNVIETIDGSEEIDWDKFSTGNYALAVRFDYNHDNREYLNYFNPGDKVQIRSHNPQYAQVEEMELQGQTIAIESFEDAPTKEYEILAVVDIPYAMVLQMYGEFNCDLILPEDEFLSLNGDWSPMRTLIDVEGSKEEAFGAWLENYTTSVDAGLGYKSKESVVKEYRSFGKMIALVGAVVSAVLGLIGLLNFANTIITSILVRSRELAMLEAVGMTGKQQKQSLIKEGFVYFIWTAVVSTVLGTVLNCTLIKALVDGIAMFKWHFTLAPLAISLPLLCVLILVIPVVAYHNLSKKSVVDRLRIE
ncbi:MAG: FtsX-like permease family protein [Lachnospiraceae bacterium]|nr:FtsX-like permease family protein [Lachnospiraceae bacterium]